VAPYTYRNTCSELSTHCSNARNRKESDQLLASSSSFRFLAFFDIYCLFRSEERRPEGSLIDLALAPCFRQVAATYAGQSLGRSG